MILDLTVLTLTIPGRERLLAEAVASVHEQDLAASEHLIRAAQQDGSVPVQVDVSRARNRLLRLVDTEWVANLADDNLWLPNHTQAIQSILDDADVVYTFDVDGNRPRTNCNDWSQEELVAFLDQSNFIDADCAVRTSVLQQAGGWPTDWEGGSWVSGGHYRGSRANFEDWEMWRRLAAAGARFRCVPEETWRYRIGDWTRISDG